MSVSHAFMYCSSLLIISTGIDLVNVAVHELGHSLGLGHSNVKEAIMAPFYTGYKPNLKLHADDIEGIQYIYGTTHFYVYHFNMGGS